MLQDTSNDFSVLLWAKKLGSQFFSTIGPFFDGEIRMLRVWDYRISNSWAASHRTCQSANHQTHKIRIFPSKNGPLLEKNWAPNFFGHNNTLKPLEVSWGTYKFSNLASIFSKNADLTSNLGPKTKTAQILKFLVISAKKPRVTGCRIASPKFEK